MRSIRALGDANTMRDSSPNRGLRIRNGGRFCAVLFSLLAVQFAGAQTLRETLTAKHIPIQETKPANLDRKITSGAELDEAKQFVIVYYLVDTSGNLNPPLYIDRYDRENKTWQSGKLGKAAAESGSIDVCFGAVLDITPLGEELMLDTHINPSAGCVLIASRDLKHATELSGWVLGHFEDGTLVYHRSQVHFATVHPTEIAVYSEKSKSDFILYPLKSDSPIRSRLTSKLSEFFDTHHDYCAKANDPCDAEIFDSDLDGRVALDERGHAVAFAISYELQGFGQIEVKPSGPSRVIYVFRNVNDEAKVEYRELMPEDVKARFGDVSLQELLDPQRLRSIFQPSQ